MRKDIYMIFGCRENDMEKTARIISEKFDIEFLPEDLLYEDENYIFSGDEKDKFSHISIREQYNDGDYWQYPDFKEYPVIIHCNVVHGSDSEKKKKAEYIRKSFKELKGFIEIEYEIFEN